MKDIRFRLNFPGIIRIAVIAIMLSAIFVLWGISPEISEGPFNFEYYYIPLSLTSGAGCRFAFTYTISMDPERVTKYDKQRIYSLSSEYFTEKKKKYGSFRTISSSIKDGQTFTYDQFPIKGRLKIKYYGGCSDAFITINVIGYPVKGERGTAVTNSRMNNVEQSSYFYMDLLEIKGVLDIIWDLIKSLLEKVGYNNILRVTIVILIIDIVFAIIFLLWKWRKRRKGEKVER